MGWPKPSERLLRSSAPTRCCRAALDGGDRETRTLTFWLDGGGLVTAIGDAGGDGDWPAFLTLRMTGKLVATMGRSELEQRGAGEETRALLRLLARNPQPEEVRAFLLNLQVLRS